jgi:hypothetical protein
MTRVPHITQTREQIAKRLKLGEKIEVEYTHRSEGHPDTNCSGYITHLTSTPSFREGWMSTAGSGLFQRHGCSIHHR